jgi:hypothetical protein
MNTQITKENEVQKKPIAHVMLDIETGGTAPGSSIFAIGATIFHTDLTGKGFLAPNFYGTASRASNRQIGLVEDDDTMLWWLVQSEAARNETLLGAQHIKDLLGNFASWYGQVAVYYDVKLWGKGAGFEAFLLGAAYAKMDSKVPWHYRALMDYRTLVELHGSIVSEERKKEIHTKMIPHTAIGDACMQAEIATAILEALAEDGLYGQCSSTSGLGEK